MQLDVVNKSRLIKYYKQKEIQKAIADSSVSREIGIRYFDRFGKRPDIITYPGDVWAFVENGATSFHCSEERWSDPMQLSTDITKKEMDELRTGWDIVMDIDCRVWEFSRLATNVVMETLKETGIISVSCKFSGNKGFHIGIPYEVFPEKAWMNNRETGTRLLFPEVTKVIFSYLIHTIEPRLTAELKRIWTEKEIAEKLGIKVSELFIYRCGHCDEQVTGTEKPLYFHICTNRDCSNYGTMTESDSKNARLCNICKKITAVKRNPDEKLICPNCHSEITTDKVIDISKILALDTQLLSSRHMYRIAYSLHEKSGLASVPIDTGRIMEFEKGMAEPEKVTIDHDNCFLAVKTNKKEAERLFSDAIRFHGVVEERKHRNISARKKNVESQHGPFESVSVPLPENNFPPCIVSGLKGLPDGRKRFLFILINFLKTVGWDKEKIQEHVTKWNEKNPTPLSGSIIQTQLRAHEKESILPPNCSSPGYYRDIGICHPDGLCQMVKNPVSYAKKRARKR